MKKKIYCTNQKLQINENPKNASFVAKISAKIKTKNNQPAVQSIL